MSGEVDFPVQQRTSGETPGRTGSRALFHTLATTFPDAHLEFGKLVAISHRSGEQQQGRIVERWAGTYGLGILDRPGAEPVS
ncbi:hypothetical protein [Pseudonocardia acidicola]|uniref:Uncharacterized protein n=1 Tax=Pseudonocardia acidicola TaxID=2724939 RepID=A0ABX1SAA6_9PSEU|nr:hypothetical protein [Pseudonocardia acidicola]NMH97276.1 hypothetical protein [Pseudonocardia acidicola]